MQHQHKKNGRFTWIGIAGVIVMLVILGSFPKSQSNTPHDAQTSPAPSAPPSAYHVQLMEQKYDVYVQKVGTQKMSLIANFKEKKTTSQLMEENNCAFGVNAGFYTPDDRPLGIFYTDGDYINDRNNVSALTNGYVYQTNSYGLTFDATFPETSDLIFAFQTGPYFTPQTKLSIANDELSRRSIIFKSKNGDVYLATLVDPENAFGGPLLSQLPQLLYQLPLTVVSAINLDGGSASAFYNAEGARFGEITHVGGFVCGK